MEGGYIGNAHSTRQAQFPQGFVMFVLESSKVYIYIQFLHKHVLSKTFPSTKPQLSLTRCPRSAGQEHRQHRLGSNRYKPQRKT